jgi:iron complex transport system substrate-binding protein
VRRAPLGKISSSSERRRMCMFRRALIACLALTIVAIPACGEDTAPRDSATSPSSTSSAPTPSPSAFPVTVGGVTFGVQPGRIVSLSATATEILFAIDAGDEVVAVDDQSTYPAEAPMTKLSGFQPNVEAIAGYTPDLVVVSYDPGGLVKSLKALAIPTLIQPAAASMKDSYDQIADLGIATGHSEEAVALAEQMRSDIAEIVASVPEPSQPLSVYHELDDTYYSATSRTFVGKIYRAFGLENIADGAAAKAGDYPQLSSEYIVSADPDLIVLADTRCCGQSAETVGARAGWSGIAALHTGEVLEADDDVVSRWGPRAVDFYQLVADTVIAIEQQMAA